MNLQTILDILNNSSVSAFLGALAAYLLVFLTDSRRNSRRHKLVYRLVEASLRQAADKLVAVDRNREALSVRNQVIGAPFMVFSVDQIKALQMQVLDLLEANEKLSLDALCYSMSAIDELLNDATETAALLRSKITENAGTAERNQLVSKILADLGDAAANLRRFEKIAEWYLNKDFERILTTQFTRDDFEEPAEGLTNKERS